MINTIGGAAIAGLAGMAVIAYLPVTSWILFGVGILVFATICDIFRHI